MKSLRVTMRPSALIGISFLAEMTQTVMGCVTERGALIKFKANMKYIITYEQLLHSLLARTHNLSFKGTLKPRFCFAPCSTLAVSII